MRRSFNLVIEYLLISTLKTFLDAQESELGFNLVIEYLLISTQRSCLTYIVILPRFNLVIEYLLISTTTPGNNAPDGWTLCFNLVIEYLLISTTPLASASTPSTTFQSRNRVSSNFNILVQGSMKRMKILFQSRNRVSSNFNAVLHLTQDIW